nr:hypothetical protein C1892_15790 [Pseudomonas sp. MPBD7-1]
MGCSEGRTGYPQRRAQGLWVNTCPCGSELARDGGVSVNIDATDLPLSRASSLPQGFRAAVPAKADA